MILSPILQFRKELSSPRESVRVRLASINLALQACPTESMTPWFGPYFCYDTSGAYANDTSSMEIDFSTGSSSTLLAKSYMGRIPLAFRMQRIKRFGDICHTLAFTVAEVDAQSEKNGIAVAIMEGVIKVTRLTISGAATLEIFNFLQQSKGILHQYGLLEDECPNTEQGPSILDEPIKFLSSSLRKLYITATCAHQFNLNEDLKLARLISGRISYGERTPRGSKTTKVPIPAQLGQVVVPMRLVFRRRIMFFHQGPDHLDLVGWSGGEGGR
ncbi:uncharacterized protein BDR25DRAFT_356327 [Lindgomyces ingoldianus]|uniref:Uncharacterized protein n=1 Tax=Lindgomyces ingoldianus TaxID=673940 RepID=A0ACB6QU35_9PLEO|nr:uncharacterized protein BDR25DRAFT_356327 [Lindgomyces ingoldianus]KAF2469595.1 hypothetical protein BDR25DRAFT_356327 [Lindgomyces ingoldianus]